MTTPSLKTPVSSLVFIMREMVPWYDRFKPALDRTIVGGEQLQTLLITHGDALNAAQQRFTSEQRDDVALTDRQQQLIKDAQSLVRVSRHAASIAFAERADVSKIMNDFGTSRPAQSIRTLTQTHTALRKLNEALTKHQSALVDKITLFADLQQRGSALLDELNAIHSNNAREVIETRDARYARDIARDDALKTIRQAYNQAQLATFLTDDSALRELLFIFSRHIPPTSRPKPAADNAAPELDEADLDSYDPE